MNLRTMCLLIAMLGTALCTGGAQRTFGAVPIDSFARAEKYRAMDMKLPCRAYLACLREDNDGVVEAAIGVVARIKLYVPGTEMNDLEKEVSRLAIEGRTASIRFRAYLVNMLLAAPDWFSKEGRRDYALDQDLYLALSNRLAKTLLDPTARPIAKVGTF